MPGSEPMRRAPSASVHRPGRSMPEARDAAVRGHGKSDAVPTTGPRLRPVGPRAAAVGRTEAAGALLIGSLPGIWLAARSARRSRKGLAARCAAAMLISSPAARVCLAPSAVTNESTSKGSLTTRAPNSANRRVPSSPLQGSRRTSSAAAPAQRPLHPALRSDAAHRHSYGLCRLRQLRKTRQS